MVFFSQEAAVEILEETLAENHSLVRLRLGSGPVNQNAWEQFSRVIQNCSSHTLVLMESVAPQLPNLKSPKAQSHWVMAAGFYRYHQEQFKRRGGKLFSWVEGCLIGGIYLVHGFAAQHRLLYTDVQVYPALPKDHYQSLFHHNYPFPATAQQAFETDIVTQILPHPSLVHSQIHRIVTNK